MSDRIEPDWKEDIFDAFGADNKSVKKGKEAEMLYFTWASNHYDKVENHESDKEKQNQGIDFTVYKNKWGKDGYTVDVKSQYYGSYFEIDNRVNGWLRSPQKKSDRIVQIDLKKEKAVDYQRKKMIDYLDSIGATPNENNKMVDPNTGKMKDISYIKIYPSKDRKILPKGLLVQYELNEVNLMTFIKNKE